MRIRFLPRADVLGGVFLAAVAAVALYEGAKLPFGRLNSPDAGFFPITLALLLLITAGSIAIFSIRSTPSTWSFGARSWFVPAGVACLLVYAVLLERVGFPICTAASLLALTRGYGRLSWIASIGFSVAVTAGTYVAFRELGVPLPAGRLLFD
jgi:tripartite tricarboxylate transporter TctB family protein